MLKPANPWDARGSIRPVAYAAVVAVGLLLTGCSTGAAPASSQAASAPATTGSPHPAAGAPSPAPTFAPDLAASENQDYFDWIAAGVLAADPSAGGRSFIDALASGGFDKTQMEVTADRTAKDLRADSIQFAVRMQGECLIGQTGPTRGGYHSIVAPVLGTGRCLVGTTRQIDW